ncbi:hypothetical protein [Microbacterium nymphoidis]|uniref:hypothetical protein n=1 Tax=Microbacterium nymphoidis TaxID=2898586 RepID=UPI001E645B3C|nr:hypothetical protein [Microbacterium nymphoidis]MCD2497674.1 hypothetical protein [Microbacterium nymphoidis]
MGRRSTPLPDGLGAAFDVALARRHAVSRARLRGGDLIAPYYGVRLDGSPEDPAQMPASPYERQRLQRRTAARNYAPRLHTGHCFSHQTAASLWDAPLPLERDGAGDPVGTPALHVTALGHLAQPRTAGVVGHRSYLSLTAVAEVDGLRVSSPAATWASLGMLSVTDLVALGDHFCRRWRDGRGRPDPGREPLATREELRQMLDAGRRTGAERLRTALELIREDSWSPRETRVRLALMQAGLPEPELNVDVFTESGAFLACVDLAYVRERVAVEYHGMLHAQSWAQDVERAARLRAAGWAVVEITAPLLEHPELVAVRVRAALSRS